MPQISNAISLPMFVDSIDTEIKYSGDPNFQILNAITESVNNKDVSDIALNCDSLNVEIKKEPDDACTMPALEQNDFLNSCDTNNGEDQKTLAVKSFAAIKPTTTYLCHKCRQIFGTRDMFEMHYK